LPFSQEQMFELIADIESYPGFMPGFQQSTITRREGDRLWVSQTVSAGPKRLSFASATRLEPPHRILIRALDLRATELTIGWQLSPGGNGCRVDFSADFHARLPFMGPLIHFWVEEIANRSFAAFSTEARRRYGRSLRRNR
jgi:coenzyme Q-binding protein COQ10